MPNTTDPEVLYHYTSMAGLLGIVRGGKLWASHIHYLNDRTEQRHLWSIIQRLVKDKLAQPISADEKRSLDVLEPAIEVLLDPSGEGQLSDYYVSSFSKNGDVLSQWLSYCPRGNGFAIGFRRDCLRSSNVPQPRFLAVEYFSRDDPESSWRHLIDYYSSNPELGIKLMKAFEPFVKDASFSAEEEYRLVLQNPEPAKILLRPGHSMLIPYVEFEPEKKDVYFIEQVIVGPCPDPRLSIRSVQLLLKSEGNPDVRVIESCVPYRAW